MKNMATAYKLLIFICFCVASQYLKAQEVVEAAFSTFDYQGCVPVKIQFTDSSTGGPTTWFWDFGEGHTSTQPNPSFTYTIPGSYKVKLVVSNSVSVDSTVRQIVISGAKAEFSYKYTDICKSPAIVNFSAANPSNTIIYRWEFGDENKAITPNPSNTYINTGFYKVSLTTISPEGCTDSIVKTIEIGSSKVDFEAPPTVCVNDFVTFSSSSASIPLLSTWKINNTVVQQETNDSLTFQFKNPGIYTIQLTEDFGTCNNTATKQIQVFGKPTAGFSLSGVFISCNYPDTVRFNNTSSNSTAFKWYFGDGDSSAEVNPVHVYGQGKFTPTLIAYNANGCTDTLRKTNAVFLGGAIVDSINLPDSGCIPHPITFNASITSPETIATYLWDFGDGVTDLTVQPSHTYTSSGRYDVKLTVTTTSGCTTTRIITNAVSVGDHSIPDFTADKTMVCGSEEIHFNGTASGPVSYWYWKFTGIDSRISAFNQTPKYTYTDTGKNTVQLIVSNGGCLDTVTKSNIIVVNPPNTSFKTQYFCDDRSKVQFTDRSIAPQSWKWDFGDGTSSNQQIPPVHNYTSNGAYTVTLTTTNGACTDTFANTVYINTRKPVFKLDPVDGKVCRKVPIELGVDNPLYIIDYLWDLGNGSTLFSDTSINAIYYKAGVYYVSLIARYTNGCQDTIYSTDSIVVSGPTANFATAIPANCLNDSTTFIDNSFSDGEHEITGRVWNYGDSTTESNSTAPYTHLYNTSGIFKAILAITDNNNCVDTARYNVIINALPKVSAGLDSFVCEGSSIQLKPSGALSYIWNSDPTLSCLSCTSPTASPVQPASYIVTGTDASSCHATDSVAIEVIHPQTITAIEGPFDVCFSSSVQLNASGTDSYTWLPADGLNNATIGNPVATPQATTTYSVIGTDSKKCFSDTGYVVVNVHPNPEVIITNNDLLVEKGSRNVINTTGSANITKWYWYPSEGLSCTDCPQPVLEAQRNITYNAVVYSEFGCTDTAQLTVHMLCDQNKIFIPSAFTPNGDGRNDRFYIISSVENPLRAFLIYNRAGELIFSKRNNITNYSVEGWDGTYKGKPAPLGTYIYRIEVVCNNTVVPFTGTVTLIR